MRKIWNTIKYGSGKAKLVLAGACLSALGVLACIVCLVIFRETLFLFGAIVCAFMLISLVQTLSIHEADIEQKEIGQEGAVQSDTGPVVCAQTDADPMVETQTDADSMVEAQTDDGQTWAEEAEETENSDAQKMEKRKKKQKSKKKKKSKKLHKRMKEEAAKPHSKEQEAEDSQSDEPESVSVRVVHPLTDETIVQYDKKKLRKAMHRYKVKRDHRMILVDRSEKLHITQTPAYIWLESNMLHLLLIEQEPRLITIPRYQFSEITYLKKQMVNEDMDYVAFKGTSMLAELFRPYLPDYTHSTVVNDLSAYKNLYGIGDIYVTNRSAAALFDLLGLDLRVDDRVTMSTKVNIFFKDAYKANIMLRDNVIDANGYADKISNILDNLAHSTVSYAEFKDTLNLMIRNKLITQEFAMYYMGVRDNINNK